jgi:hypothetical protein
MRQNYRVTTPTQEIQKNPQIRKSDLQKSTNTKTTKNYSLACWLVKKTLRIKIC